MLSRISFTLEFFLYLPFVQICLGVVSGILVMKFGSDIDYKDIIGAMFLFCVFLAVIFYPDIRKTLALAVFFISFINGVFRFEQAYSDERLREIAGYYNKPVNEIQIKSTPKIYKSKIVYRAQVSGVPGDISLTIPKGKMFNYGDLLAGEFVLKKPASKENFDYGFYLNTQGIFYTCQPYSYFKIGHKDSLLSLISSAKVYVRNRLQMVLPNNHLALVTGLLWGESDGFDEEFEANLSKTGTTHIVAVSGFNVSIVVLAVMKLAGKLHRKTVVKFTVMILILYTCIVGFSNLPAMRAGVMGFVVLFNKNLGRKTSFLSLVSMAVLVLSMINPLSIFTVSFQLSFTAMIGIVGLSKFFESSMRSEVSTTLSAIVATSPVTLANFQSFSTLALIVNLIILPLIPLLTLLGFIELIMALLSIQLARIFALIMNPLIDLLIYIINFSGNLKISNIAIGFVGTISAILVYSFLFLLIIEIAYRRRCYAQLFS